VTHIASLADDPDNKVRAAVVSRRDLDPVLRESISVDYDDRSSSTVAWLKTAELAESDRLTFARSRHQILRKTLAMRPDLSDETVDILARDESFAVRLFVCERQPNAPGWLLAQIAADWKSYSRWDMLRPQELPRRRGQPPGAIRGRRRSLRGRSHPGLPVETIEALLADTDDTARQRAATNPVLPTARLIELLGSTDLAILRGASANPALSEAAMLQILNRARL